MIRCFQIVCIPCDSIIFFCVSDFLRGIWSILSYNWGIVSFLLLNFKRSANAPSIGEMWLVLDNNRLNYRKSLIAAWWNYSWVIDKRRYAKLSIFPLLRRMSAMLDFPPYWNFRHVGFRRISFGPHLCFDFHYLRVYFNVNPFLVGLCCLYNPIWLTVHYLS